MTDPSVPRSRPGWRAPSHARAAAAGTAKSRSAAGDLVWRLRLVAATDRSTVGAATALTLAMLLVLIRRRRTGPAAAPAAAAPTGSTKADLRRKEAVEPVACQRADPELWFSESPAHLELAKAHCRPCPLRAACLTGAVERGEPWGVWGGEIFDNGVIIAQKRGRGRPRKDAQAA